MVHWLTCKKSYFTSQNEKRQCVKVPSCALKRFIASVFSTQNEIMLRLNIIFACWVRDRRLELQAKRKTEYETKEPEAVKMYQIILNSKPWVSRQSKTSEKFFDFLFLPFFPVWKRFKLLFWDGSLGILQKNPFMAVYVNIMQPCRVRYGQYRHSFFPSDHGHIFNFESKLVINNDDVDLFHLCVFQYSQKRCTRVNSRFRL